MEVIKRNVCCVYYCIIALLILYDGVAISAISEEIDEDDVLLNPTYLTFLTTAEHKIYEKVKSLKVNEDPGLKQAIKEYMVDYEDSTVRSIEAIRQKQDARNKYEIARNITSNPIVTYRMIRRLVKEFNSVYQKLDNYTQQDLEEIFRNEGLSKRHGKFDLYKAIQSILRLSYFYDNTNAYKLSKGIMGGSQSVELTTEQMLEIAQYASQRDYYLLALEWLLATELRVTEENNNTTKLNLETLDEQLQQVIEMHDKNYGDYIEKSRLHMMSEPIRCNTNCTNEKIHEIVTKKPTVFQKYREQRKVAVESDALDIHYKYIALCNGENFQEESEKSKLTCFLDRKRNPYFSINPLKIEILNRDPLIYQVHQAINDRLINEIKKTTDVPPLFRNDEIELKGAVLEFKGDNYFQTEISKQVEFITNYKVVSRKASEPLGVLSISFGGHVNTHVDVYGDFSSDINVQLYGDLMSSVVIGLDDDNTNEDLALGFPILGMTAKAIKGSITTWPNKLKNGMMDNRSMHGVCPVFQGHKWIATKFIHERENFLKMPCALDSSL